MFAAATLGSSAGFSFGKSSSRSIADGSAYDPPLSVNSSAFFCSPVSALKRPAYAVRLAVACSSGDVVTQRDDQNGKPVSEGSQLANFIRRKKMSAGWETATVYKDNGLTYEGKVVGFNNGGLLVRFFSLVGFLPYTQMSPYHLSGEQRRSKKEIAKGLMGSIINVKAPERGVLLGRGNEATASIQHLNPEPVTLTHISCLGIEAVTFSSILNCLDNQAPERGVLLGRGNEATASIQHLNPEPVTLTHISCLGIEAVIEASEEKDKLILSEKCVIWSKFSDQVHIGDIFEGKVDVVEDFGAFVHLRFPDGRYYFTGLVHISEVSWDLIQDVRDILKEGDDIRVKVINIDREKERINLSIRQLQEDPLLETLDKVIPQIMPNTSNVSENSASESNKSASELLPGLESICEELQREHGITDVSIGRRGFEKRVVSQDLELWLSNAPVKDRQFTILARAGREVQEIQVTTDLDPDSIKQAVQRVLGRIP